ncbi:MAG: zinc ribbon domain-containing protein [Verrucomicrobiota bacterium]
MKLEEGDLVASGPELTSAPSVLDLPIGPLSRIPQISATEEDQGSVARFFSEIPEDFAITYRNAIAILAGPTQAGVLHYTLGEESISRAILAYGPQAPGQVVIMISAENTWRICVEPTSSLVKTISSVLLEQIPLSPVDIRGSFSQDAGLVLLALLHLLRESRMSSILSHLEPTQSFEISTVEDVINDSSIEDFRWPFFFFDKVFPFSSNAASWEGRVQPALEELISRKLISAANDNYHLTSSGYRILVALHQHLTKVAIRITRITDKGSEGHEAMLLVRSLQDLFLFDFGGKESTIASLDFKNTELLISDFLKHPNDSTGQTVSSAHSCPVCAARIPDNTNNCPECGVKILSSEIPKEANQAPASNAPKSDQTPPPYMHKKADPPLLIPQPVKKQAKPAASQNPKFCIKCGIKLRSNDKFCKSCGAKVIQ